MPRNLEERLKSAESVSKYFETDFDPDTATAIDGASLRQVAQAFQRSVHTERELADAVAVARAEGHSWAAIGGMMGVSGEAARQRYGARDA